MKSVLVAVALATSILAGPRSILSGAHAAPTEEFPFNNQLPPVAYYGQSFEYEFSADTFKSSTGSGIAYSSSDLPSWLSLDGNTRTLSGTPPASDANNGDQTIKFTLNATDNTGQASAQYQLQLSSSTPPTFSPATLQQVLESSGKISSGDSFVLSPNQPFEITFPQDFFTGGDRSVVGHYAVTGDHSPLPIWLNFDGATNKFWGTAPTVNSNIAQSQSFDILFIDSTYAGYASAYAEFHLVLGANVLAMNISTDSVNATVGKPLTYEIPFANVTLNGQEIQQANLSDVKVSIPEDAQSWLKYNDVNDTLMGTPPQSAANETITVNFDITDTYNDTVSFNVAFDITEQDSNTVFSTSSLPDANVTQGSFLTYSLERFLLNKDADITLDAPAASFLTYHSNNYSITGQVPDDFNNSLVSLQATLSDSSNSKRGLGGEIKAASASAHFTLYGVKRHTTSSSMSSSATSSSASRSSSTSASSASASASAPTSRSASGSASASSTAAAASASITSSALRGNSRKKNNSAVAIGCGVGIPVGLVLLALIAVLLWWCTRRRRRQQAAAGASPSSEGAGGSPTSPSSGAAGTISAPRPTSKGLVMAPVFRTDSQTDDDDLEFSDTDTMYGTPEKKRPELWDSPQRASAMNFLTMDGANTTEHGERTTPLDTLTPVTNTEASVPPVRREEDDEFGNVPRESWRHTNVGDRRWQDARISYSSLASIVPTEPPTVQPAQGEFAATSRERDATRRSSQFTHPREMGPPSKDRQSMVRDPSSGILHRVGSHSSSLYTDSGVQARDQSFPLFRSDNAAGNRRSGGSDVYRTASSGGEETSFSDEALDIRPYRDDTGEVRWAGEGSEARVQQGAIDRKPSKVTAPDGHHGELAFV